MIKSGMSTILSPQRTTAFECRGTRRSFGAAKKGDPPPLRFPTLVTQSLPSFFEPLSQPATPEVLAGEAVGAAVLAGLLLVWQDRPRGSAASDLIEVRESAIHGKGVFARQNICEGAFLGYYPGRLRTPEAMAEKIIAAPNSKGYCWQNGQGYYLDPTDTYGQVSTRPAPGLLWPFEVEVHLAYVNEPPLGVATINLVVEDGVGDGKVQYIAARDISAGEDFNFFMILVTEDDACYNRSTGPKHP
ncbi:hypothetical protein CYMTET_54050 [Cymbomonas tetramitiformis]|uniref:Uncharacterized protein n=1 Tax=Cymbomonas tetramitiformis TaxID=36881 RepID=A0AAE0BFW6_9CHLO|nr:hypothetical protein CYMTET_54050 [Cymbomonas tetramitiformis]